jgi:hypothetical protein
MIEIALRVCICLFIGRAAELDGHSSVLWGAIALALCILSTLIPIPGLRVLIAGLVAYGAKFAYNLTSAPVVK